jgi:hypothetical protein
MPDSRPEELDPRLPEDPRLASLFFSVSVLTFTPP